MNRSITEARGNLMKAAYYETNGKAADVLKVGDVPIPPVEPGEVRVKIYTSGVNPSDVKARSGTTQRMIHDRVIPHSDGAGVIEAVGSGVSRNRVGERVWIYNAQWSRPFGTAAEYVILPNHLAVPLPDKVDFAAAANLGIPVQTAHAAVFTSGSVAGQTILVQGGAGAVGHYAIQFAKWGGARVITTVSSGEKAEHVQSAGADFVINYKTENVVERIKAITDGNGVDQIIEVEFGENLLIALQVLKPHGTIVIYGSEHQMQPTVTVMPLLVNCITLRFLIVYNLTETQRQAAIRDIDACLCSGFLQHTIAQRFPLAEVATAHLAQESKELIGNIVVDIQV